MLARRNLTATRVAVSTVACTAMFTACTPSNPAFPLARNDARDIIVAMTDDPQPLDRPLIILGGFIDPGLVVDSLAKRFRSVTASDEVVGVSFAFDQSVDVCRDKVFAAATELFPEYADGATPEVDVIAFSMGGLIARDAATMDNDGRRLRIRRLFTISSPHRGAALATLPTFNPLQISMRAGSPFLQRLDAALPSAEYELIPYVRLDDRVVGAENAAPDGEVAWWVPNPLFGLGHTGAFRDERFFADIMCRLRGEGTWTRVPRSPLPGIRAKSENGAVSGP